VKIDVDVREQDFPTEFILRKVKTMDVTDAVVRLLYTVDEQQKGKVDERKLYAALQKAFLVAGVSQLTDTKKRQRPRIAGGLSILDTLVKYIEFTPDLQPLKDDLQHYAKNLIRELEASDV
jgi:hypothetical protein